MSQSLTDEQTAAVRTWAEEGADLPTIQKRLDEEFEVRLTFMDSRFLLADLGIELKAEEEPEVEEQPEPEAPAEQAEPEPSAEAEQPPADVAADDELVSPGEEAPADMDGEAAPAENVTVTISELQRPGMMASGNVTFGGGQTAEWYLDQMGQLGMNPTDPEFRPSPEQMLAFQQELQLVAQKKGM